MKTNKLLTKIICISLVMILAGVIICVSSFISGGRPTYLIHENTGFVSLIRWDSNPRSSNENSNFTNKEEVKAINIDSNVAQIRVVTGDTFNIQVSNIPKSYIEVNESNGVYSMKVSDRRIALNYESNNRDIVISVPSTIEELIINNNVGEVNASNLTLKNFQINVNVGDVQLQNVIFEQGEFNLDLGDLEIYGDFNKYCKVKNNAGDVDIKLLKTRLDYNYNLNVDLGELSINDENHGDINASYNQNNQKEATLEAKLSLGDLDVEFLQGNNIQNSRFNNHDNDNYDNDDDYDHEYDD